MSGRTLDQRKVHAVLHSLALGRFVFFSFRPPIMFSPSAMTGLARSGRAMLERFAGSFHSPVVSLTTYLRAPNEWSKDFWSA